MQDNDKLAQRKCVPCAKAGVALSAREAEKLLLKLQGWRLSNDEKWIEKTLKFKNFIEALHFINKVGEVAETQGHHPDIAFGWGYATVKLQTHSIGGLHENDFIVAARIDALQGEKTL